MVFKKSFFWNTGFCHLYSVYRYCNIRVYITMFYIKTTYYFGGEQVTRVSKYTSTRKVAMISRLAFRGFPQIRFVSLTLHSLFCIPCIAKRVKEIKLCMAFHEDTLRVTDPSVHSHHHHHHHTNLHPNCLKISLRTQTYFHETVKLKYLKTP